MRLVTNPTYDVRLGFAPEAAAIPDPDHPGLLRAGERGSSPYGGEHVEFRTCPAVDLLGVDADLPDLFGAGFDVLDLTGLLEVQAACERVFAAGLIDEPDATIIRSGLEGASLPTASGATVTVRYLAGEGFIMRTGGPNGLSLVGPRSSGMNGHGSASSVHADQDVYGTPLVQLMDGRAPELFVHDSPDGHHHDGSLFLANLWIPLQQITQPLVLADGRSIDRRRHQLRFGLATDSFLERDEEQVINDIWQFLHDEEQQWYFRSEMDHRQAYVFNTLSTPHGAAVLPGEDVAEWCYLALEAAEVAAEQADAAGVVTALTQTSRPSAPGQMTPALGEAIATMTELIDRALADPAAVCGAGGADWASASAAARRRVVRMSLELRLVVSVQQ
jgi:hypothetical protein